MNKQRFTIPIAASCLLLAATVCSAAETSPPATNPPAEKPSNEAALESKIQKLEKRIQDLEAQLDERAHANADPQVRQFHDRMKRDFSDNFDEMFDQMRKQMEDGFGMGPQFGPQIGGPQLGIPGIPGNPFARGRGEKPRLGVQLAPITDDLRDHYKNDAREGAFVIAVVPDSPAEKAGIMVGDAITRIGGKDVKDADAATAAVRSAPAGKLDIEVLRQNKDLLLKADLSEAAEDTSLDDYVQPGPGGNRWLRRNHGANGAANNSGGNANGAAQTRTELKASALEMNDDLASTLKLTDEQRKKMSDVLTKEAQAASDEASNESKPRSFARGGFRMDINETANVGRIVDKHIAAAETALRDTLNAEQMRQWQDYRKTHSSVQFSQSMNFQSGDGSTQPEKSALGF